MESKLTKLFAIFTVVTLLTGCLSTKKTSIDLVKLIDGDVEPHMTVSASIEDTKNAILTLFGELKKELPEKKYKESNLSELESKFTPYIKVRNVSATQMSKRFYSIFKSINTKEYDNVSVLRLSNIAHRKTPTFMVNNEYAEITGNYLAVISQVDTGHSLVKIVPRQLAIIGSSKCAFTLHGFKCGNNTNDVLSDPYEQYRILMYISDGLDYLKIDNSIESKQPTKTTPTE